MAGNLPQSSVYAGDGFAPRGEATVNYSERGYDEEQFNEHSEDSELSAPFANDDPSKTVDSIASRANDWREPSRRSEERYVLAIRQWLDSLQPFQRERARKILHDAHPGLRALRIAIREKKAQLAAISFNRNTRPDTLPRLGQELQSLREALRGKLKDVGDRLRIEAGVPMGPLGGDGFWLAPPDEKDDRSSIQPFGRQPHLG